MSSLLLAAILASAPAPEAATSIGIGNFSCGRWIEDHKHTDVQSTAEDVWLEGFVTGADFFHANNPGGKTDREAIRVWVSEYCQAHPLDSVAWAARNLIIALDRR